MNHCPLTRSKLRLSMNGSRVPLPRGTTSRGYCTTVSNRKHTSYLSAGKLAVPPRLVLCHAESTGSTSDSTEHTTQLQTLITALARASNAWEKYDKDRNGTMSLKECEDIFNSPELGEAVTLLTNIPPRHLTADDLEPFFRRADRDRSGSLSRSEFLALYLAVVSERVKRNPLLLAEALLGFLDRDRNGVLEGGELKVLLGILGFPAAMLLPIPGFLKFEYRSILRQLGKVTEGNSSKGKRK